MHHHHRTPYQRQQPDPASKRNGSSVSTRTNLKTPTGPHSRHQIPVTTQGAAQQLENGAGKVSLAPSYQSYAPHTPQIPLVSAYSHPLPVMPSYSTQALRTFEPKPMSYTPDAILVPIRSLQAEKVFVVRDQYCDARVSGRTVRVPEVRAYRDKRDNGQRWIQSFTIKDDHDTLDVKLWHKTQEHLDSYAHISLDQVVHVWTDEIKLNLKPSIGSQTGNAPSTTSPLCLNVSEGKVGHKVELGNRAEAATLFRTALGANIGGVVPSVSIKQTMSAMNSSSSERINLVVCVKKMVSSALINSKNGLLMKTLLTVFDAQGQEASLTLWGKAMASIAQTWIPLGTTLILTGSQVGVYAANPQITVGYNTHIQLDPECKNVEWLRHYAAQCSTLPNALKPVATVLDVPNDHIRACYLISEISQRASSLGTTELAFGFTYAVLSELDIETRASDILMAKCFSCKGAITSYKMETCSKCHVHPKVENTWSYALPRHISFMDDTGELRHPSIASHTVEKWLGVKPNEFSALSIIERMQLKKRYFLERFKIYFKVSWSDFKKKATVHVISMELAHLADIEGLDCVQV